MADTYLTSGCRFAKRKFLTKTYNSHPTECFLSTSVPTSISRCAQIHESQHLDLHFAELMETLRVCMNDVLRLPFSVQTRGRLVRNYWDIEQRVREMRLMLDPVVLQQLQSDQLQQAEKSP